MIKNRFISLVLKYKKNHPYIFDEEEALRGIASEMELTIPLAEIYSNSCHEEKGVLQGEKLMELTEKLQSNQEDQ